MSTGGESIYRLVTAVVVGLLVVGTASGTALVGASDAAVGSDQADGTTIVVDDDGGADYQTIQAAVDAAAAGDTVEVRPGNYEEKLVVDKSITLVAPRGATLDGSSMAEIAVGLTIPAGSEAEPVVDGFEITGYEDGVNVTRTEGAWTIRNATIKNNENDGVVGDGTSGAWTISNSTIKSNEDEGVDAENTTGPWTIRDTRILDSGDDAIDLDGTEATAAWTVRNSVLRNAGDDGIDADDTSGAWTVHGTTISEVRTGIQAIRASGDFEIRDTIILNATAYGVSTFRSSGDWSISGSHIGDVRVAAVEALESSGAWTVSNTTVHSASTGIHAGSSSGAWTVTNTTMRNVTVPDFEATGKGTGLFAANTTGAWEAHDSNFLENEKHGLNATGADPAGNATGNWWGQASGPADGDCVGNADCGEAMTSRADVPGPLTVQPGYYSGSSDANENQIGLPELVVIASLAVILAALVVLSRRYT